MLFKSVKCTDCFSERTRVQFPDERELMPSLVSVGSGYTHGTHIYMLERHSYT